MGRLSVVILVCLCFIVLVQTNEVQTAQQEYSTPMEQSDVKSIDEINRENELPTEEEATPMEQSDVKSIDEINRETEIRD